KRGGPPVIGRPFSRHIYCWNCHWRTAWTNRGSTHRRVVPLAYWHGSGVAACSSIGELFFVAHTTGQKIFSHDDITTISHCIHHHQPAFCGAQCHVPAGHVINGWFRGGL